jgi:hypothetical protein
MANKRGRKRTNELYFGPDQEQAVIKYLESNDQQERNELYTAWLQGPLNKMIESIIRRYKLYRKDTSFEELHNDTLSFLMTKAHKFKESKGTKAYSYYGTICKHYILGLLMKDEKYIRQVTSYDEISDTIDNRIDMSYDMKLEENSENSFIKKILDSIRDVLDDGEFNDSISGKKRSVDKKKITENERKVGEMLVEILSSWETTFNDMEGGNKFNKISILSSLREGTNLSTKDIRSAMKRFKELYVLLKDDLVGESLL